MRDAAAPEAVRVEGVRFAFPGGEFELRVEELNVTAGESVAVVGPSGTGKTTLLDLIAGIRLPDRGRVTADGFAWSEHSDAARRRQRMERVGLVFQEFELLDHLTVRENILLAYHLDRRLRRDATAPERATDLARAAGIEPLLARRPRRLSQGERQRVAICRALATEPRLVLADEPTGNLDPETAGGVLDLLFGAVADRGATLVMVTHDRDLLGRFDRVVDVRELGGAA